MMRVRRTVLVATVVAGVTGCSRPDAAPVADSPQVAATATPAGATAPNTWSDELGRFLALPAERESLAFLLSPGQDAANSTARQLTLVNAAGDTATVTVQLDTLQCGDVPMARLGGTLRGWWVGLQDPAATVLRMDSLEAMPRADSARITTALARLASGLASEPRYTGLPFAVVRARRFVVDGREVIAAHLVRRVPQEAAPHEEHTFLVVERAAGSSASYQLEYTQQSEGIEENAEHFEVLATLKAGDALLLLLARDRLSQSTYQVLRRSPDGEWSRLWSRDFRC